VDVRRGTGKAFMTTGGRIKAGRASPTSKNHSAATRFLFREVLRDGFDGVAEDAEFTVGAVFAGAFEIGARNLIGIVKNFLFGIL